CPGALVIAIGSVCAAPLSSPSSAPNASPANGLLCVDVSLGLQAANTCGHANVVPVTRQPARDVTPEPPSAQPRPRRAPSPAAAASPQSSTATGEPARTPARSSARATMPTPVRRPDPRVPRAQPRTRELA